MLQLGATIAALVHGPSILDDYQRGAGSVRVIPGGEELIHLASFTGGQSTRREQQDRARRKKRKPAQLSPHNGLSLGRFQT